MKNFLIAFFILILGFVKITYAKSCDAESPKKSFASIFYHDKKHNININLGRLFTENSNLIFEPDLNEINKDIPITANFKPIDTDKIIERHKQKYRIKVKVKKDLIKTLKSQIDLINKNNGFYPDVQSKYLDIETKEISYLESKLVMIKICDERFIEILMHNFYENYDLLVLPQM